MFCYKSGYDFIKLDADNLTDAIKEVETMCIKDGITNANYVITEAESVGEPYETIIPDEKTLTLVHIGIYEFDSGVWCDREQDAV